MRKTSWIFDIVHDFVLFFIIRRFRIIAEHPVIQNIYVEWVLSHLCSNRNFWSVEVLHLSPPARVFSSSRSTWQFSVAWRHGAGSHRCRLSCFFSPEKSRRTYIDTAALARWRLGMDRVTFNTWYSFAEDEIIQFGVNQKKLKNIAQNNNLLMDDWEVKRKKFPQAGCHTNGNYFLNKCNHSGRSLIIGQLDFSLRLFYIKWTIVV